MRPRFWLTLGLLLLTPLLGLAQTCPGQGTALVPFAKETKVVSTTAVGLTQSTFQNATLATIQVVDASIAYDIVGTPTTTDSPIAGIWSTFPICGIDSIRAFKAIRYTTADARLIVRYYKSKQP